MENTTKKSRKKVHNYLFDNENDCKVEVNLNGYVAVCTVTGNEKKFYHSYLANMIEKKYDNNIDTFEQTYISREGKGIINKANKVKDVEKQITKLYNRIRQLKSLRDAAEVN